MSAFYSHGLVGPCVGGDECFKFMTSWGGEEGGSIGPGPLSFVPLENPDFPNARKKARQARPAGLQGEGGKKAERPLSQWSTNEVANCHRKPLSLLSFSLQIASKPPSLPP